MAIRAKPWIEDWHPDDDEFWERQGKSVARRNITFSIFAEFLAFCVWTLWSVTAVSLNKAGFHFSTAQLFTLVALPTLMGATLRVPYTFAVGRFGGRNWTTISALLLLIPTALLVLMVSHPGTPYWAFLLAAATAGFGGGNFASSMANISYFYPDRRKGVALGLNAAGGNVGVAVAQLVVPIVITWSAIAVVGGSQGKVSQGRNGAVFLQNAGLFWMPFIVVAAICAWVFMDNLKVSRARIRDQLGIFRRKPTWVMSLLYIGTFGSFLGYSSGLPLLIKSQFPNVTLSVAYLGPLVGSLARPVGGWLADRLGGARVTLGSFGAMILAVVGVIFCLAHRTEPWAFAGFFASFLLLFILTGIGNGSTFQMIPKAFQAHHLRSVAGAGEAARLAALGTARVETAAALGFIAAIGAYGGWLIPQGYGVSTSLTGGPIAALWGLIAFYVVCLAIVRWNFLRPSPAAVESEPTFAALARR
ncbi:MAG: transporter, family, nitrate/nitrite transporter [Actinomycetota bacterium]|nr:transporter, family, nitrate/nitrite transporter [Actinomycetota bacterium]